MNDNIIQTIVQIKKLSFYLCWCHEIKRRAKFIWRPLVLQKKPIFSVTKSFSFIFFLIFLKFTRSTVYRTQIIKLYYMITLCLSDPKVGSWYTWIDSFHFMLPMWSTKLAYHQFWSIVMSLSSELNISETDFSTFKVLFLLIPNLNARGQHLSCC